MVRLLLLWLCVLCGYWLCFNPTMVRLLRDGKGPQIASLLQGFNPTMVRLLQVKILREG